MSLDTLPYSIGSSDHIQVDFLDLSQHLKSEEKLYYSHCRCYLSTISLKDSYLFKIVKLVFNFYLKLQNFKEVKVFY